MRRDPGPGHRPRRAASHGDLAAALEGRGLTTAEAIRPHAAQIDRRVWFQPLLLLVGVLLLVPVAVRRTPSEWLLPVLAVLAVMTAVSLTGWLTSRRLHGGHRTAAGWTLVSLAAVTLLIVSVTAIPDRPEHVLPFAVAIAVAVAPARRARLRLPFQAALVAAIGLLLVNAGRAAAEVALALFLLVFVTWLAGMLARSLLDARHEQLGARADAERRADLLTAVRDLSARTTSDAARTAVESLRTLGFSVAGVSIERGGVLVPVALEGVLPASEVLVGQGLAGTAVAENRTVMSDNYAEDPRRLPGGDGLGAVVAVPIRSSGRPVGVVIGGREGVEQLPGAVVEVAEVLAGHLGAVLETEQRVDRQRELLERMQALEAMRGRLLTEVSEEVRDPLTVVRGIAETLVAHGDRLSDAQRARLLQGFVEQTGSLRATIDALLDFSRLQAARPTPALTAGRVRDALEPATREGELEGDHAAVVRTDPLLLAQAVETIRMVAAIRRVVVTAGPEQVRLRIEMAPSALAPRSRLLFGLAERLVVAAGGSWEAASEAIEVSLPRAAEGVGQDAP